MLTQILKAGIKKNIFQCKKIENSVKFLKMNEMKKMHDLFIEHLRITNDSEMVISKALSSIKENAISKHLQELCEVKLEEKRKILTTLNKIFELLNVNADGKQDAVIRSFIGEINSIQNKERNLMVTAKKIFGVKINIYQSNAYRTAISCAVELNDIKLAELLSYCLNQIKFDKEGLNFLKEEMALSTVAA
jgi:ferritin-like metal-binding protein YciE